LFQYINISIKKMKKIFITSSGRCKRENIFYSSAFQPGVLYTQRCTKIFKGCTTVLGCTGGVPKNKIVNLFSY